MRPQGLAHDHELSGEQREHAEHTEVKRHLEAPHGELDQPGSDQGQSAEEDREAKEAEQVEAIVVYEDAAEDEQPERREDSEDGVLACDCCLLCSLSELRLGWGAPLHRVSRRR